jgi:hypothetical protein
MEEGGGGLLTRGVVQLRRVALQPPCLIAERAVDVHVLVRGGRAPLSTFAGWGGMVVVWLVAI